MWLKNALRKGAGLRGGRAGAPCRWLAVTDFHPEHNKAFQTVKLVESEVHESVSKAKKKLRLEVITRVKPPLDC